MGRYPLNTLVSGAIRLRLDLTPLQVHAFEIYLHEIIAHNERAGLTSVTDREGIQTRHFLESLAVLRAIEETGVGADNAIDIGAGAGFPGLPIKIVREDLRLTLLEATAKKTEFLRHIVATLSLTRVSVIQARAEDLGRDPAHRGAYSLALARAVAPLPILIELALPFLSIDGLLATPKGSGVHGEIEESRKALEACGGTIEGVNPLDLPDQENAPYLVLVRKTSETPDRYPRRPGIPSKRPLR